jgi:U3 small nucleolar RNA-associated protein 19
MKTVLNALRIFFVESGQDKDLIGDGSKKEDPKDDLSIYQQWIRRQYSSYTAALLSVFHNPSASSSLQISAVISLMESVRSERGVGIFSKALYSHLLTAMLTSPCIKPESFTLLFTRYLQQPYADIRYYSLWAIKEICSSRSSSSPPKSSTEETCILEEEDVTRNIFDLLSNITSENPGGEGMAIKSWCGLEEAAMGGVKARVDKNESAKARRKRKASELAAKESAPPSSGPAIEVLWANAKAHRRAFSDAWLTFLTLKSIPKDIIKKVLIRLHTSIIPHMTSPVMLSDFLTHSLDQPGIVGMLALNGLFILVTQHGLEYPLFYQRLYQLVTADSFAATHRAQFYKLADLFLSSGLLPAYSAGAFAKKMARLALSAPPAGAMTAISFIHNILRRHPACMAMLDRTEAAEDGVEEGSKAGEDVFDMTEQDPGLSRAVESSLWELQALRQHYCPQVSALCSILDKDLANRRLTTEVDLDPVLAASYSSLLKQEAERRIKHVPLAFFKEVPQKLFDPAERAFHGWSFDLAQ